MGTKKTKKVREEIENHFRPLFSERAADGGIPLVELRTTMKESRLPPQKVNKFLNSADQDQNALITYDEFYDQLMREDEQTLQQLALRKRVINKAIRAVAPDRLQAVRIQPNDAADYMNWGEEKVENYVMAYDCRPPPFFIPLITLSEIAVFIYYAVTLYMDSDLTNDVTSRTGVPLRSPLIYSPHRRKEAWRFIGYMFLHQGYVHLIFNCIMQIVLGTLLEIVHKFWRVGIVYILGVLAGSLAHSCFDASKYLVGASGGCYALIGAHFATVITNWDTMQKDWLESPVNFLASGVFRLIVIFLLAGGDTGIAIYDRFSKEVPTNVGFSAHIGGALAGILVGVPVLRNLEVKYWEKICFWICIVLYCMFMIGAIIFNVICADRNLCYPYNSNFP